MAYGECSIDGSPMDYESNGAGKALNDNGLLSSTMLYRGLFEPESAAALLLNLSDDSSEVKMERLYEESGSVNLEITFLEDEEGLPVRITMVQPYGDIGIWIPKDYRIDPLARFMKMDEVRSVLYILSCDFSGLLLERGGRAAAGGAAYLYGNRGQRPGTACAAAL